MDRRSAQAPSSVIMIRPHHVTPNEDTAADNAFQQTASGRSATEIAKAAHKEVTDAATALQVKGVRVHVFEDETD